jgi:hypothetical protein
MEKKTIKPSSASPQKKSNPVTPPPEKSQSKKSTPQKSSPQKSTPQKSSPQKSAPQKSVPPKSPPQNKIESSVRAKLKNPPPLDLPLSKEWFYCDEVMTELKVTRDVLNKFIKKGLLITHEWGGTMRINKAYLDWMIVNGMRVV